jgi:hypothetical protein
VPGEHRNALLRAGAGHALYISIESQ